MSKDQVFKYFEEISKIPRCSFHFDLDAELKIYVAGMDMPISKKFDKNLNIYQLQAILAEYILR